MNPSPRRNTCDNVVNRKSIKSTVVAKCKPEPKTPVYDYEAAIDRPDILKDSKIDNNTQNVSWSELSDKLSAPTKKRNLYVRGQVGVITKKRSIVFKSKKQAKEIAQIRPSICDFAEIAEKESTPFSEIIRDVENYGMKNSDDVTSNRQTSLNQVHSDTIYTLNLL